MVGISTSKILIVPYDIDISLTLLMLRSLSCNAQKCKTLGKLSKPYHVGIHWKALTEYSQMSTHMPGFH